MILFYYDLADKDVPYSVTPVKFSDTKTAKQLLVEYYKKHEGESEIEVAIIDCLLDEEKEITLVDVLSKYVNFEFIKLWVVSPLRVYSFENVKDINAILPFSRVLNQQVEIFKDAMKINVTDDVKYFFVGHNFG